MLSRVTKSKIFIKSKIYPLLQILERTLPASLLYRFVFDVVNGEIEDAFKFDVATGSAHIMFSIIAWGEHWTQYRVILISQSLRGLVAACRHAFEFSLRKVQKCNDQNWKLNNRSDFGWTPLFIPHCQTLRLHSVPTHRDTGLTAKKQLHIDWNVTSIPFPLMRFTTTEIFMGF